MCHVTHNKTTSNMGGSQATERMDRRYAHLLCTLPTGYSIKPYIQDPDFYAICPLRWVGVPGERKVRVWALADRCIYEEVIEGDKQEQEVVYALTRVRRKIAAAIKP